MANLQSCERKCPTANPQARNQTASQQAIAIAQLTGEIILLFLKIQWAILVGIYRLLVPVIEKSVKGEIVLVTGAGHGIGKELALQYAALGATVVCWDINEHNNRETVKEIDKLGYPKAHAYVCNVADRNQVNEVAKKVQKEVGHIGILINNAGIMPCHPFLQHTPEEIERTFNINILAHCWILQAILPIMIKNNHGHIVSLSSCAGLAGIKFLVPYCASKWAVRGLMEALNHELSLDPKCQIKFTTIYPYIVDTGLCKRPKIRFDKNLPMLSPKTVAKHIIRAQRTDKQEASIPRNLLSIHEYCRIFPNQVGRLLQDFVDSYVDPDL